MPPPVAKSEASAAKEDQVEPTFYHIVVGETFASIIDSAIEKSIQADGDILQGGGRLANTMFGRNTKVSATKRDAMKQFIAGSKKRMIGGAIGGEDVPALADAPCDKLDSVNRTFYMKKVESQSESLGGVIKQAATQKKVTNSGQSGDVVRRLKEAVTDIYELCEELELLNIPFDVKNPVHCFGLVALEYMALRRNSDAQLAKDKSELVSTKYKALKAVGDSIIRDREAEPELIYETTLSYIDQLDEGNAKACEDHKVGVDIPVQVMFAVFAKLPFSYTPSTGSLGEMCVGLREHIVALKDEKLAELKAKKAAMS